MSIITVGEHIVIDSQLRQLTAFGERVELPERSYRLLLALVENAPNIVSHDELIKAVWQQTVVSDESLKQRVSRLRKQLAKVDPKASEYFIAERGLGYRCSAQIRVEQIQTNEQPSEVNTQQGEPKENQQELGDLNAEQTIIHNSQTQPNKTTYYLWSIPVIAIVIILTFFNQGDITPLNDQNLSATTDNSTSNSSSQSAELTPDDFEKQARQYYYRFNTAANDSAIGLYRQAINIDPNYALGYFGLGNSYAQGYYQYGKPYQWLKQSLQYSKQTIEISPEQAWGYKSLGLGLYLDGKYTKAIENYQKSSELADWWASPVNNQALAQMEIGQLIPAYKNAIKAIELGPKDPIPYLFLGLIYRDLAMQGHATKAINRAINFMPDYNLAITYQAEFYLINGQYQQAITSANKALTTNFNNQLAYWVIAHAWLAQANVENTIIALQKAADLGGRYTQVALAYLAILSHQPLKEHQIQLQATIEQGNQWFEYPFALAAIKAANNQQEQSLQQLQNAVDAGLNHPLRLRITPFFKPLTQNTKTNSQLLDLITQLEEKISVQRQKVIQIEQSGDF